MMDTSLAKRGPIVEGEGLPSEAGQAEGGEEAFDDESPKTYKSLKRGLDDDFTNAKKRRKQLKPIRIATNLEDMVKVPKQIIGLNNDLDNVNDLSHAVPKETSSNPENSQNFSLNDVHLRNDGRVPLETSSEPSSNCAPEKFSREIEKPEIPEINVPNLEMGPNFVTNPNFIFPFSFQPMRNPNFWSDANLKIFNQEAYCELCKKEFCNKYFLKTHKANKHGIYTDFPAASWGRQKQEVRENSSRPPENGKNLVADPDCERAFCEVCNKRFCNKYFVRRHKSKSHGLFNDDGSYGLPGQDAESTVVQNSTTNSTKKCGGIVRISDPLISTGKEDDFDNQKQAAQAAGEVQKSPLNLIVKEVSDEEDAGDEEVKTEKKAVEEADECSSENIEKLETMLMRLNPSEVEGKMCKFCREVLDGTGERKCGCEKKEGKCEYLSEANDSSNESKNDFPASRGEVHDFLYVGRLDHLKQTKPTSSYCEICNKELCNKYFMRTHMQRMHGIEIEHGTQIGGVVCNICNKELCSKYFLRVHKQNTHGIVSPNSLVGPSTSGPRIETKTARDPRFMANFSQVCYICNKRFRSPKWLQAHFLSDHRDESVKRQAPGEEAAPEDEEEKEESSTPKTSRKSHGGEPPETADVISKLFWENNSSSKSYNCSQCPFSTSVLAFLFVHERSHYVLPQDQSADSAKPPMTLQSLLHDQSFWQHKITQQISECLDLSSGKSKYLSMEQNGS